MRRKTHRSGSELWRTHHGVVAIAGRWLRHPEIRRVERVALHLEVEGLVIHSEKPSCFTLIATRGVKSQAYRLSLRLGGGAVGELLQREARLLSSPSHMAERTQAAYQCVRQGKVAGGKATLPGWADQSYRQITTRATP